MNDIKALENIKAVGMMGSGFGLERMQILLHLLGNPEKQLKFVHIAGTNGKGSTAKMLASILTQAGLRTGLYTSPHLLRYNERFQIDGHQISDKSLTVVIDRVTSVSNTMPGTPTQFELLTCIAFCYFAEAGCDIVVLEVGLGGRLDATNVIPVPEVAVITHIGPDHMDILGDTPALIAREKAGIIKPGGTVVLSAQTSDVMNIICTVCKQNGAILQVARPSEAQLISRTLDGQYFQWRELSQIFLPLLGAHQIHNACTVLQIVACLRKKGWNIDESAILDGLRTARWPGRFECVSRCPAFFIDGGHNRQCAEAIALTLHDYFPHKKCIFLIGILADKDFNGILETLIPLAKQVIAVTPDSSRALSADALCAHLCNKYDFTACRPCADIGEAVSLAQRIAAPDDVICACGSLYLVGEIRAQFHLN